MAKIKYFLYHFQDGRVYGINACREGVMERCAYVYFHHEYANRPNSWTFPGLGSTMDEIVAWAARNRANGEFISACRVRKLFKEHGFDIPVIPPER